MPTNLILALVVPSPLMKLELAATTFITGMYVPYNARVTLPPGKGNVGSADVRTITQGCPAVREGKVGRLAPEQIAAGGMVTARGCPDEFAALTAAAICEERLEQSEATEKSPVAPIAGTFAGYEISKSLTFARIGGAGSTAGAGRVVNVKNRFASVPVLVQLVELPFPSAITGHAR
jgi:hypothetical protein